MAHRAGGMSAAEQSKEKDLFATPGSRLESLALTSLVNFPRAAALIGLDGAVLFTNVRFDQLCGLLGWTDLRRVLDEATRQGAASRSEEWTFGGARTFRAETVGSAQ